MGKATPSGGLNKDQEFILDHWTKWGLAGYPIEKVGRKWLVRGQKGCGYFPILLKTKAEAIETWEGYIRILLDYKSGRLPNPALDQTP